MTAYTPSPIYIDDSPRLKASEIRARARSMKARFGCRMFAVDHLQEMAKGHHADREYDTVTDACREMKAMAKELECPVVLLSQLNRSMDNEQRKPRLSDLRASGAIEETADTVILLS